VNRNEALHTIKKANPGDRVVAIQGVSGKSVRIYGLGTFEGEHPIADEATGFFAEAARAAGLTNPRIKLDSGKTVWGCECWWAPEGQFAMYVRMGYALTSIDISEEGTKVKEGMQS
jgi:hypothetical protein